MKLIVGLGNPGKEYEKTRHNIGFTIVDDFLEQGTWKQGQGTWKYENKRKGEMCIANVSDQKIIFLKPMEFMNHSGGAVGAVANFYKIEPKNILVVHDDIDLPVGKVQLKLGGSSAGHNGLKDIIAKLGTKEFRRLRIGVDRPVHQEDVADYVLDRFSSKEKDLLEKKIEEIFVAIREFIFK